MLSPQEVLNKLLEHLGININQLAKNVGFTRPDTLYSIRDGLFDITKKTASKITLKYPYINPTWLITGDGDMLLNESTYSDMANDSKSDTSSNTESSDIKQLLAINKTYADSHKDLTEAHLKAMANNEKLINIINANSFVDPRIYQGPSLSMDRVLRFLVEKYGLDEARLVVELGTLSFEGVTASKASGTESGARKLSKKSSS